MATDGSAGPVGEASEGEAPRVEAPVVSSRNVTFVEPPPAASSNSVDCTRVELPAANAVLAVEPAGSRPSVEEDESDKEWKAEDDEVHGGSEDDDGAKGNESESENDDDAEDEDGEEVDNSALVEELGKMPKGLLKSLLGQGKLGSKPLHSAAAEDDLDKLRELLGKDGEMSGSVDDPDPFEYTALHVAAEIGNTGALEVLVSFGADVEACTLMHKSRPLHYAAFGGHVGTCEALLKAGADHDARTDDLRTPLFHAAEYGHTECVRVLRYAGADPAVRTRDGRTALSVVKDPETRCALEEPPAKQRRRAEDV